MQRMSPRQLGILYPSRLDFPHEITIVNRIAELGSIVNYPHLGEEMKAKCLQLMVTAECNTEESVGVNRVVHHA